MMDEATPIDVAEKEDFSAAAPPHPGAAGAGETSFGDADVPAASEHKVEAPASKEQEYLELARRTKADFENFRKRMARENAAAIDRGMAKLAKELLPAIDHLELALKAAEGHEDVVKGFVLFADEL